MIDLSYVKYDDDSAQKSVSLKNKVEILSTEICANLTPSRERSLAVTKLEEAFMWIGKAIRNDQIYRRNSEK